MSPSGSLVYAGFDGLGFSVFSRDPATGALTLLSEASGQPSGGPLNDATLASSGDGNSLYGLDDQGDSLTQYSVSGDGVSAQATYPVLADTEVAKDPTGVVVSPDGTSVYVTTYGYGPPGVAVSSRSAITTFERSPSTGALTVGATLQTGGSGGINSPVVSPDGSFVYAGDTGGVDVFSRDASTGALTSLGTDGSLPAVIALAIAPDGSTMYTTGPTGSQSLSGTITVFSRDASSGQLTDVQQLSDGSAGVMDLSDMWGIAVSPDGECVYATSRADDSIASFARDPTTGELTFDGVSTETGDDAPGLADARQIAISPDSRNVYVASPDDNGVGVFTRSATGCALTYMQFAQDVFSLGAPMVNSAQGSATLPVAPQAAGSVQLTTVSSDGSRASSSPEQIPSDQTTDVAVPLDADQQSALDRNGSLDVTVDADFTAAGGVPTIKSTTIDLIKTSSITRRPAPSVSAGALRRDLAKIPLPRGRSARIVDLLRAGGTRVRFAAPEGGRLMLQWVLRLARVTGRRGHRHRRLVTLVLAKATAVYHASGSETLMFRLTASGRRLLQSSTHRLRVEQSASFVPKKGRREAVTRTFVLLVASHRTRR